jgi:hypothetical protein
VDIVYVWTLGRTFCPGHLGTKFEITVIVPEAISQYLERKNWGLEINLERMNYFKKKLRRKMVDQTSNKETVYKTRYELVNGKKPNVKNLVPFYAPGVYHVERQIEEVIIL